MYVTRKETEVLLKKWLDKNGKRTNDTTAKHNSNSRGMGKTKYGGR